ncbi:alternate-type signal peptide domain-containing protein [Cryobacterium sp. Hh7]|uniref:alternate-type signal peptide domain-containing protein n=1 Tax=Cryobacterium sp. Hh7 TaxID=1259159 RepID=UPI001F541035|nr:alternate-type signal peptide domain-containing protein [Cryobacterium sp. Hh7]
MLKGSIAGAAGVALLLGGAGTFALWNDDAAVAGAEIKAGTLTVDAADGVWTDQMETVLDMDEFLIVPGDKLTYQTVLSVAAHGDNIKALLSVTKGQLTAGSDSEADVALEKLLKEGTTLTAVELEDGVPSLKGPVGPPVGEESLEMVVPAGDTEYLVTVTVNFKGGVDGGKENPAKTGAVDLSELAVLLTQTLN